MVYLNFKTNRVLNRYKYAEKCRKMPKNAGKTHTQTPPFRGFNQSSKNGPRPAVTRAVLVK